MAGPRQIPKIQLSYRHLQTTELYQQARQAALRKLNRRECSSGEISLFLKRKGFPSEIISEVIAELVDKKWINHENYARILIREQILRGKGPNWIQMKLKEKKIPVERSDLESLFQEISGSSELQLARQILLRRYPLAQEDPEIARKAIQALLRRGFSFSVAREALSAMNKEA